MRLKEIWDDWMEYDEDGFYSGIRADAPAEVKEAYEKHVREEEAEMEKGYIAR